MVPLFNLPHDQFQGKVHTNQLTVLRTYIHFSTPSLIKTDATPILLPMPEASENTFVGLARNAFGAKTEATERQDAQGRPDADAVLGSIL